MENKASLARRYLEHMLVDETAEPKDMPVSLLEEITDGFSVDREIGRGGFAVVYKGILGTRGVAVKILTNALMDETKFHQEVECLMEVKHKNVVRLLGYCDDRQGTMQRFNGKLVMAGVHRRLLCFEYISYGSLDNYITDKHHEWSVCYKIIKGICEGLQYLHDKNIVHLDLKPANILLDDNMTPKITDFGVSRCFDDNQSQHITQNIMGTMGYLAPEILHGGRITRSADLYSLGVVIFEILTGQRSYQTSEEVLQSWSDRLERSQRDILCKQIQACYEIALECIDFNPEKRPHSAQSIIDRLGGPESITDSLGGTESIQETGMAKLLNDVEELRIKGYHGGLTLCKKSGGEHLEIGDVSHITLSDLQKLNSLRSIHFEGCDEIFFAELDESVVFHLVQNLHIDDLRIDGELFLKVLRCFPGLSKLMISQCKNLELVPVKDGGLLDLRMLQSFRGSCCGKLFFRWQLGEVGGGAHTVNPFPTSLRELDIFLEPSMQSMGLLSNLRSLTSLRLKSCKELTIDGFNPLIAVNLKTLVIDALYSNEEDISLAGDLLSKIARSNLLRAGSFQLEKLRVDSISAVLTAPICSHLAPTLQTLNFNDRRARIFTKEQEHSLHLLSSLRSLEFYRCTSLESLPRLHSSSILSPLLKEGFPTSLKKLNVNYCSPKATKQAKKLRGSITPSVWFDVVHNGCRRPPELGASEDETLKPICRPPLRVLAHLLLGRPRRRVQVRPLPLNPRQLLPQPRHLRRRRGAVGGTNLQADRRPLLRRPAVADFTATACS